MPVVMCACGKHFCLGPFSFSTWDFPLHHQRKNLFLHENVRLKDSNPQKQRKKPPTFTRLKIRLFKTSDDLSPKALVMPMKITTVTWMDGSLFSLLLLCSVPMVGMDIRAPELQFCPTPYSDPAAAVRSHQEIDIYFKQTCFRLFVLKGWESPFFAVLIQRQSLQHIFFLSCQITQISTHFPASFSILLSSTGSPVLKILFRQPSQHFIQRI